MIKYYLVMTLCAATPNGGEPVCHQEIALKKDWLECVLYPEYVDSKPNHYVTQYSCKEVKVK